MAQDDSWIWLALGAAGVIYVLWEQSQLTTASAATTTNVATLQNQIPGEQATLNPTATVMRSLVGSCPVGQIWADVGDLAPSWACTTINPQGSQLVSQVYSSGQTTARPEPTTGIPGSMLPNLPSYAQPVLGISTPAYCGPLNQYMSCPGAI